MNKPKYIVVHTAAFKGDISESTIDEWHRARGFNEGGYHYFINYDGLVEKGREENEVGAHCRDMGMNRKSIGICFEGHGNLEDWTKEQIAAFLKLAHQVMDKYNIPPTRVIGHRETGAKKDCPGTRIDMGKVRAMVCRPVSMTPLPPNL